MPCGTGTLWLLHRKQEGYREVALLRATFSCSDGSGDCWSRRRRMSPIHVDDVKYLMTLRSIAKISLMGKGGA